MTNDNKDNKQMCTNKANFNPGFSQINYDRTNQKNVLPGGEEM